MANQLFKIKQSSTGRLRMLAACDIQPGRRIVAEEPFIILPHPSNIYRLIEESKQLSEEQLHLLNSFPPVTKDEKASPIAARINHLIPLSGTREGSISMFRNICRVSHSCVPNACYSWNDDLGKEVLHAITLIPADAIISVSFVRTNADFLNNRSAYLQRTYGFECTCPVCTGPAESRDRLGKLQERHVTFYETYMQRVMSRTPPTVLLREIDGLILDVAKEEGADIEWGGLASYAYQLCAACGNVDLTREWAMIGKDFWSLRRGLDCEEVGSAESMIRNPKSYPEFGIFGKKSVIGPSDALKEYASRYKAFVEQDLVLVKKKPEDSGTKLSKVQKKNAARRAKAKEIRVTSTSSDGVEK